MDLPAATDAARGGFLIDAHALSRRQVGFAGRSGTLRGKWGFETFDGPSFHLRTAQPAKWMIPLRTGARCIVGRDDARPPAVRNCAACV